MVGDGAKDGEWVQEWEWEESDLEEVWEWLLEYDHLDLDQAEGECPIKAE